MTAEQWLADLEAKAKAATPGPWKIGACLDMGTVRQRDGSILADCRLTTDDGIHNAAFISSANPATVLRLVGMVRWLADNIPGVVRPCAGYSRKCFLGDITKCEGDSDAECWIAAAYIATETRHDQN